MKLRLFLSALATLLFASLAQAGTVDHIYNGSGSSQIIFNGSGSLEYIYGDIPQGVGTLISSDSFTGTNGLAITTNTHTLDTGGFWSEHTSYGPGDFIFASNRIRSSDANTGCYYSTATPASADYYVETVLYQSDVIVAGMGPAGRINTAANTMYLTRYNSTPGEWQLLKLVAGTPTTLGTYTASTSNGVSYTVRLSMVGTAIKVYLGGSEVISVTDSDIVAAGKAGIRGTSQSGGHHIDSFVAVNQ